MISITGGTAKRRGQIRHPRNLVLAAPYGRVQPITRSRCTLFLSSSSYRQPRRQITYDLTLHHTRADLLLRQSRCAAILTLRVHIAGCGGQGAKLTGSIGKPSFPARDSTPFRNGEPILPGRQKNMCSLHVAILCSPPKPSS